MTSMSTPHGVTYNVSGAPDANHTILLVASDYDNVVPGVELGVNVSDVGNQTDYVLVTRSPDIMNR